VNWTGKTRAAALWLIRKRNLSLHQSQFERSRGDRRGSCRRIARFDGHRPRRAATSRLTVDDWVKAGFGILAQEGITALKIDRLCSRLDVTKGSFYWHFTDIAGHRATLIEAWGELRDDDRNHFACMSAIAPWERLSQMMSSLLSASHWMLERAMREWARTDDAVAASVRAADQRLPRSPSTSTSPKGCPNYSYPRATAAYRRHGRRMWTPSAGWPTDVPPAPGRWVLHPAQVAGHVVFDYDTSRELAGALILGMDVPRTSMV
jgi:AcrR family transcriptional regulator